MSDNRLPRSTAPDVPVAPTGRVWDQLCAMVEAAQISVPAGGPLALDENPIGGGKLLTANIAKLVRPAKITGAETGGMFYKGRTLIGHTGFNSGGTNGTMPGGLMAPPVDDLLIVVPSESGFGTNHALFPGTNTTAVFGEVLITDVTNESTPRKVGLWLGPAYKPGDLFTVALTQTGGAAGDATTKPTYTYTVKDLAGNTIGTSMSPVWAREVGLLINAATHGTAYWNSSGVLVLFQADEEYETTSDCS